MRSRLFSLFISSFRILTFCPVVTLLSVSAQTSTPQKHSAEGKGSSWSQKKYKYPSLVQNALSPAHLEPDVARQHLQTLVNSPAIGSPYKFYLLSLPLTATHLETSDAPIAEPWYPNGFGMPKGEGFKFLTPVEFSGKFDLNTIEHRVRFVKPEFLPREIPIAAAKALADSFFSGLVARLFLDDYFADTEPALKDLLAKDAKFQVIKEEMQLNPEQQKSFNKFFDPVNFGYQPAKKKGSADVKITSKSFDDGLAELTKEVNMQTTGLLVGWKCGSDIIRNMSEQESSKCRQAVYALARERFTLPQVVACASHAICYLEGWAAAINYSEEKAASTKTSVESKGQGEAEAPASSNIAMRLYSLMLADYAACLIAVGADRAEPDIVPLQNSVLEGFFMGTISGADQVMKDAYDLGYRKGYKDGFRAGYTAGLKEGFSKGYAAAAKRFNEATQQISKAEDTSVLDQALGIASTTNPALGALPQVAKFIGIDVNKTVSSAVNRAKNWCKKTFGFKF